MISSFRIRPAFSLNTNSGPTDLQSSHSPLQSNLCRPFQIFCIAEWWLEISQLQVLRWTHLIFGFVGVLSAELIVCFAVGIFGGEGDAEIVRSFVSLSSAKSSFSSSIPSLDSISPSVKSIQEAGGNLPSFLASLILLSFCNSSYERMSLVEYGDLGMFFDWKECLWSVEMRTAKKRPSESSRPDLIDKNEMEEEKRLSAIYTLLYFCTIYP